MVASVLDGCYQFMHHQAMGATALVTDKEKAHAYV
jgi:hypothetical protein